MKSEEMTKREGGVDFDVLKSYEKRKFNYKEKSYVYVLRCSKTGAFKVGLTTNLQGRISTLQTGYPHKLKLQYLFVGACGDFEFFCHEYLKEHRLNGEWFSLNARFKMRQIHNINGYCQWFDENIFNKTIHRWSVIEQYILNKMRIIWEEKQLQKESNNGLVSA
jgi:hypothetical protein